MALGREASWKWEGSSLRKYQEIKRGVQILGQNRYLHCWQSFQTFSVMWIHLFMPVPTSVTDRHLSFREKRFTGSPVSPIPTFAHPLEGKQTNPMQTQGGMQIGRDPCKSLLSPLLQAGLPQNGTSPFPMTS